MTTPFANPSPSAPEGTDTVTLPTLEEVGQTVSDFLTGKIAAPTPRQHKVLVAATGMLLLVPGIGEAALNSAVRTIQSRFPTEDVDYVN